MQCPCGKEYLNSSTSPWVSAAMQGGRLIHATCQHGVGFDFEYFNLGDKVHIRGISFWRGSEGIVQSIHEMGKEYGILLEMCCYGKVTVYIKRENLTKAF